MSRLQAPVHYAVQTSPTRAGSYPGPYTIINPSADASTVWVADNAGLQVNQGTPIYPGTSLRWEKDGDLWVVGESAGTQIIISYDVADWQPNPAAIAAAVLSSGVLIVDNPEPLLLGHTLTNANPTGPIDVSRFQSLWVELTCQTSVGLNQVRVFFNDDNPLNFDFPVDITMSDVGQVWTAVLPVQGEFINFNNRDPGSVYSLYLVGSYRQVENPRQAVRQPPFIGNVEPTTNLYFGVLGAADLPAGSDTVVCTLQPWIGEIEIDVLISVTGATSSNGEPSVMLALKDRVSLTWTSFAQLGAVQSFGAVAPGTRRHQITRRLAVNGEPIQIIIRNPLAVALNAAWIRVTPITGALAT